MNLINPNNHSHSNRHPHKKLKTQSTSIHHHQHHHHTCSDSDSDQNLSSTSSSNHNKELILNRRPHRLNRNNKSSSSNHQSTIDLSKASTSRVLSPLPPNHHCLNSTKFKSIPIRLDQLCDPHHSFSNNTTTTTINPDHSSNILQHSARKRKRRSPNENHHHSLQHHQSVRLNQLRSKPQTTSSQPPSSLEPADASYQEDDQYYLNQATKTQLSRLKRNHLINLSNLLSSSTTLSTDLDGLTKESLISLILDARSSARKAGSSSAKSDPIEPPIADIPRRQSVRTNSHQSGTSHSRSPRQMTRTKSLPYCLINTNTRSSRSGQRSAVSKRKSDEHEERDELGESSDCSDHRKRESNRKVKFGDPHATPIVHRTRATTTLTTQNSPHSNHSITTKPIIGRLTRSKSKSHDISELAVPPSPRSARKLRNGKVIRKDFLCKKDGEKSSRESEEDGSADDELENESEVEEEEEDRGEGSVGGSSGSVEEIEVEDENEEEEDEDEEKDADQEDEEEEQEEEVNLADATSKRLLRLKRDNLVKLCEERELEVDGTKKELVQHLLKWRNTNENDGFSQSSDNYPSSEDEADNDESVIGSQGNHQVESSSSSEAEIEIEVEEEEEEDSEKDELSETPITARSTITQENRVSEFKSSKKTSTRPNPNHHTKKDEIGELLDLESLNLQDKEIQSDQLKKLEMIGSGGFKDVYKGIYKRVQVAIADIRGHLTEMDLKELRILRDLRHENIVRFIGVSVPEDSRNVPIMIVTEICTNGDLFDYLRSVPSPGLIKIGGIMKDIARGLDYLHSRDPVIIHRDLKSSNVLITSRGVAKLNDFGLARIKNSTRSMVKSLVGTVNWQAPELWVAHPRYNEKVDVYSAGLVLWEMLQWHQPIKRYPFEGQNEHAIYQDVGQRQLRPSTAGMRRHWGDEIVNLIELLWNQNPSDRPDMKFTIKRLDEIIDLEKNKKIGKS